MFSPSATGPRTAVFVVVLALAALFALNAIPARAEAPPNEPPCAEGRALQAARLAYLEARIAPEPSQQDAWRAFADAFRASSGGLDRLCAEGRPPSPDAAERLERMEKHAAAMQELFGGLAKAYQAIAPVLTPVQRDILARNIVPSHRPPGPFPPPPGFGPPHGPGMGPPPGGPEWRDGPGPGGPEPF